MKWTWAPNQESSHIIMANCLGHFSCSLSLAWIGEELNTVKWHCKFHYIESERKLILEFIYIRERMREEACRKYLRLVSCSLESTLHCWAPTKSLSSRWAGRGWHNKGLGWDGPSTFHSIPWCCCCVLAQSGQQGVIIRWTNNKTGLLLVLRARRGWRGLFDEYSQSIIIISSRTGYSKARLANIERRNQFNWGVH